MIDVTELLRGSLDITDKVIQVPWFPRYLGFPGTLVSQVPCFPRYTGFSGTLVSHVHWFLRYPVFPGILVSQVPWFPRYPGFPGTLVSQVPWFRPTVTPDITVDTRSFSENKSNFNACLYL